jgi:hypothetical protein
MFCFSYLLINIFFLNYYPIAVAYWYKLHRQVLCWSTTILRQQQQAQDAATQLRLYTLFALFPYWEGSLNW